ncbi:hypothetical protein EIP91_009995 [Steccherinum ochraceum]|uniref:Uncharacterized protein n=1 Tax=Steccherinum ochraceum TaxID=92696 RepID=A0A4R0RJU7_9APHY|nr:hypothetical protein EIP91_009995 [Steccherinum ochraceum]
MDLPLSFDEYSDGDYVDVCSGLPSGPPSPLVTLPVELLVNIWQITMVATDGQGTYAQKTSSKTAWHILKRFMSVCRYWRDAALLAPILWRDVECNGIVWRRVAKMLQRSGQTPLHLTATCKADGTACITRGDVDELITREFHRVEKLCVIVPHAGVSDGQYDMPILRVLKVDYRTRQYNDDPVPLVATSSPLPLLEELDFAGMAFTRVRPYFRPTLRRLQLASSPPRLCAATADLIYALQHTPFLEELCIRHLFDLTSTRDQSPLPLVQLPHLKVLRLEDEPVSCGRILDHLVFPSSIFPCQNFTASSSWASPYSGASIENNGRLLAAVFSKLAGRGVIGDVQAADSLSITYRGFCNKFSMNLEVWDSSSQRIFTDWFEGWKEVTLSALLDCISAADTYGFFAAVRTLHVSVDNDYHLSVSPSTQILTTFGQVQTLHIKSEFQETNFETRGAKSRNYGSQPHLSLATVLIPQLHTLILTSVDFRVCYSRSLIGVYGEESTIEFISRLRDAVRARKEQGAPLKHLEIRDGWRFVKEDAEILRKYVERVVWDCSCEI